MNETNAKGFESTRRVLMQVPVTASQTRQRPSKELLARSEPSHEKSRPVTGSACEPKERRQRALRTSQSLIVSSYEPLATTLPRGLYAQQHT